MYRMSSILSTFAAKEISENTFRAHKLRRKYINTYVLNSKGCKKKINVEMLRVIGNCENPKIVETDSAPKNDGQYNEKRFV